MYKTLVFVALVALTSATPTSRRAAPPAASQNTFVQDLEKHAGEFSKTFTEQLNALTTSKNSQDLQKALKDGTDSVLQQLSAFSNSLQTALVDANGKAKEALESSRAALEKTAEDLRKSHPEVEQQAAALKERLTSAVKSAAEQTQKLAQTVAADIEKNNAALAPKVKAAYDDFVKNAQNVQKQLHEAANKQ